MKYIVEVPNQLATELTIEEFRAWFEMFLADKSLASEFKVRRVGR